MEQAFEKLFEECPLQNEVIKGDDKNDFPRQAPQPIKMPEVTIQI